MTYDYTNIETSPNLSSADINGVLASGIHYDVENSAMTDKTLEYCTWHEDTQLLIVVFTGTLSGADKALLDGIVTDNI